MKMKKIAFVLIVIAMCVISNITYAVDISGVVQYNTWVTNPAKDKTTSIGGQAIAIMQAVGVSIAVVMLIAIAIKYMTSSPDDKAELKKHMVPFVFGAFFIFAAVAIIGLLKNFFLSSI